MPATTLALAAFFGIFVLPFLLPPAPIDGFSAANTAGFNNRIATIAAAFFSVLALVLALRRNPMPSERLAGDDRRLSARTIALTTILASGAVTLFCRMIATAHFRYTNDTFYFAHQLSMYADYGRSLYDQIEFPYGPLLFYAPVALHAVLRPFGVSLLAALLAMLVIQHILGLLMVAWVINALPMLHRWRMLLLVIAAIYVFQPNFAPNYTFFRFFAATACVVLLTRQQSLRRYAAFLFLAQILCLAISPEIGFAFCVAAVALTMWRVFVEHRAWGWSVAVLPTAIAVFLLLAGPGYLRMLGNFSRGLMNFVVEPQPFVLVFLFALLWLVPPLVALAVRQRQPEAALYISLYALSLALLPAAFGRVDAAHVYFNEHPIFLLSFVAIGYRVTWKQTAWAIAVTAVLLAGFAFNLKLYDFQLKTVVHHTLFGPNAGIPGRAAEAMLARIAPQTLARQHAYATYRNPPFDFAAFESLTNGQPVALPFEIDLAMEEELKSRRQYAPSFSYYVIGVVGRDAEQQQLASFHEANWALVPNDRSRAWKEDHAAGNIHLRLRLPWEHHRPPYRLGQVFYDDLSQNWQPAATLGDYTLYRRKQ